MRPLHSVKRAVRSFAARPKKALGKAVLKEVLEKHSVRGKHGHFVLLQIPKGERIGLVRDLNLIAVYSADGKKLEITKPDLTALEHLANQEHWF